MIKIKQVYKKDINGIVKSDNPELQAELDRYFNENEDFVAELNEVLTGAFSKGFEYMYAYKKEDGTIGFECADSIGVVEVREKDTDDGCEYVIYWYIDRIEKGQKKIKRIQVWDKNQTYYYVQDDDGKVILDESEKLNPKPHIIYTKTGDKNVYYDGFGFIPFFRLDNCKKQFSDLKPVKDLIDDYDLMACGLSNNLQDASEYLVVVKGFQGDNLDELMKNVKTKKHIGVDGDSGGDVEFKTVDIPYQARMSKIDLDEKGIYRFGMGLNTAGLKDTAATTNIAIKAAYSLLDMKAKKKEIRLKQFLRKILKVVIAEINKDKGTDYQMTDVYFDFEHEIMSNAQDNAQIELIEAQTQQAAINAILSVAAIFGDQLILEWLCDILDVDYTAIKNKLPQKEEDYVAEAQNALDGVVIDEQTAEGNNSVTNQ